MRKPLIAGNWKMYKTYKEAVAFISALVQSGEMPEGREVLICPPYLYLDQAVRLCCCTAVQVGAQNCALKNEGAYTGEISPAMLKSLCVSSVIIGHSERREYYGETDETVAEKVALVLDQHLQPIVCVGEKLAERESGAEKDVVKRQIEQGLANVAIDRAQELVIAYEPVWAIGTGKTATPAQAQEMHAYIRSLLLRMFGSETAEKIRILYGGSIKPENIDELMSQNDIDGGLVGGASLKLDSFLRIVNFQ